MSQFSYKAVNGVGQTVSGVIEAPDRRTAVANLTEKGQFVTELFEGVEHSAATIADSIRQAGKTTAADNPTGSSLGMQLFSGRVSGKEVLAFTTQLSTALKAGLPLMNCLEMIRKQQRKHAITQMLNNIIDSVSSGKSLSDAMAEYPKVFSPLYLSMIRVGEAGGMLERTTAQLAKILDRDEKIKSDMAIASAYPIFVLCLGIISSAIIVTFILPKLLGSIGSSVPVLPLPTRILLSAGDIIKYIFTSFYGWLGIGLFIAGILWLRNWTKNEGKLQWNGFKLKIPILGSVVRTIAVGRFARTLGALTEGGVTILDALKVVRDTLGNERLAVEIDTVAEKVKAGEPVAEPLEQSGYFPPLLVQIVGVGEQTGKLDELLLNAADTFDNDADSAIKTFMSIFPALLIVILAMVIGLIIIAALLPLVMLQLGSAG